MAGELVFKWNDFILAVMKSRKLWEELQKEVALLGAKQLELEYEVDAQKHLSKFRGVKFEWMMPLLVNYYRGAGGIEALLIKVVKTKEKEKKNDGKSD